MSTGVASKQELVDPDRIVFKRGLAEIDGIHAKKEPVGERSDVWLRMGTGNRHRLRRLPDLLQAFWHSRVSIMFYPFSQ